jgi:hypothetical protein
MSTVDINAKVPIDLVTSNANNTISSSQKLLIFSFVCGVSIENYLVGLDHCSVNDQNMMRHFKH